MYNKQKWKLGSFFFSILLADEFQEVKTLNI